jgi:uncharacterized protein
MAHPVVHFEVWGKDGNAIQSFYKKAFKWPMNVSQEMGGYGMTQIAAGRGIEGGVFASDPKQPMAPNGLTFYIETDDINKHLKAIEKAGGKLVVPRMEIPGVVTFAQFSDPAGNIVGLVEAARPGAAQAQAAQAAPEKKAGKKAKAAPKKAAKKVAAPKKPAKKAAAAKKPAKKAAKAAKA